MVYTIRNIDAWEIITILESLIKIELSVLISLFSYKLTFNSYLIFYQ